MSGMTDKIEQMVAKHDAEIHAVNQRLSGIESAIGDIKVYLQNDQKPNFHLVGLILSVWVLSFSPLIYGFQMNQSKIERHEEMLDDRARKFGIIDTQIEFILEDINELSKQEKVN
jgi:hypothetical protein